MGAYFAMMEANPIVMPIEAKAPIARVMGKSKATTVCPNSASATAFSSKPMHPNENINVSKAIENGILPDPKIENNGESVSKSPS